MAEQHKTPGHRRSRGVASMILRVVNGQVPPGRLDAVVRGFERDFAPAARASAGLERFAVGARVRPEEDGHDIAAMTLWSTIEAALAAYGGELGRPQTLDRMNHGETLTRVDYYEVDAAAARRRDGDAAHLRLTAGTVARGLDADIQQQLRQHLPGLPDEAAGAWIGRRVIGADVEIAFMSIWTGVPEGWSLDAPIWPSISDQYATFRAELYDLFLAGAGTV